MTEPLNSIATQAILDIPAVIPAIPTLETEIEGIGGAQGTGVFARLEALEQFAVTMAETFGNLFPKETGVAKVLNAAGTVATVAGSVTPATVLEPAVPAK